MFVATAVLTSVIAFVMGAGSLGKLSRAKSQIDTAGKLGIRWHRYRLIAMPEAAAAVGLLVGLHIAPIGVAAAVGVALLMAGAVVFRVRVRDAVGFVVGDAALLLIACVTAALRVLTA